MSGSLSHQSSYHSATRMELVIECFYGVQRNKNVSKWRCQQLRKVASIQSWYSSGLLSHQSSYHSATRMGLVIECFYGVQRNKNVSKWRCQQLRKVASIQSRRKYRDHSATSRRITQPPELSWSLSVFLKEKCIEMTLLFTPIHDSLMTTHVSPTTPLLHYTAIRETIN